MVKLLNKIECKYQTNLNFAQIMGARLCICKDRKVFSSKTCIRLHCDRISFFGSKQYSLKVENIQITWEYHFSLFKICQVLSYISLGLLVMQTLYIINFFLFLIGQYLIDRLESILKLFQSFSNTLLHPKNIFYNVHTFWIGLLDNDWAH